MFSLLGLDTRAVFPIMMGACGIVQPVAGLRFLNSGRFAWGPSVGLVLGGVFGVLLAVYVVKQLPLWVLRWVVIVVVTERRAQPARREARAAQAGARGAHPRLRRRGPRRRGAGGEHVPRAVRDGAAPCAASDLSSRSRSCRVGPIE